MVWDRHHERSISFWINFIYIGPIHQQQFNNRELIFHRRILKCIQFILFIDFTIDVKSGILQNFHQPIDVIKSDGPQCQILKRVRVNSPKARMPSNISHPSIQVSHEHRIGVLFSPSWQSFVEFEVYDFEEIVIGLTEFGLRKFLDHLL